MVTGNLEAKPGDLELKLEPTVGTLELAVF